MKPRVYIDAGPVAALLNRRDEHHAWATAQVQRLQSPFYTCEAALTEALYLLAGKANLAMVMRGLLDSEFLKVEFALCDHLPSVLDLMSRYASVPMSLADACLVRMCERGDGAIFAIDSDFYIYRRHGRQALSLIIPPHG